VEANHARYFAALAERAAPALLKANPDGTVKTLERDQGNLRAALEWCLDRNADPALGLRLAAALGRYWYLSEQWREGCDWLNKALRLGGEDEESRAASLTYLGEIYLSLSEHSASRACFDEAIASWRRLNNPEFLAWTLVHAGSLAATTGRHAAAEACFEESLALYRAAGNRVRAAFVAVHLSSSWISNARYAEAIPALQECLAVFSAFDYQGSMVVALNLLGRAQMGTGNTEEARTRFEEALAISLQRNMQSGVAWALLNLGLIFALQGDFAQSERYYRRALDAYVALGRRGGVLAVLDGLAAAMVARGSAGAGVCLMAATERLRSQIDESLSDQETSMRHAALEHARQLLTQDAWQAAWRQGESLGFARAVALAQSG
jgi:tetratricopeptide (TPR) repeat protein